MPLGTLVRLPGFKELHCPRTAARPCVLIGTNLFLIASISASSEFGKPADVPPDFTGTQLSVPHPANGVLYMKLRDDANTVQTLTLPVMPMSWLTQTPASQTAATPSVPAQTQAADAPEPVAEPAPALAQPKATSAAPSPSPDKPKP
jgi:hypothetical protein